MNLNKVSVWRNLGRTGNWTLDTGVSKPTELSFSSVSYLQRFYIPKFGLVYNLPNHILHGLIFGISMKNRCNRLDCLQNVVTYSCGVMDQRYHRYSEWLMSLDDDAWIRSMISLDDSVDFSSGVQSASWIITVFCLSDNCPYAHWLIISLRTDLEWSLQLHIWRICTFASSFLNSVRILSRFPNSTYFCSTVTVFIFHCHYNFFFTRHFQNAFR